MCIDVSKFENYSVYPLWLSDHDTQRMMINDIQLQRQNCQIQTTRKINKHTMNKFIIKL